MTRALLIDKHVIERILDTVDRARANPLSQEELARAAFPKQDRLYISLEDRSPEHERPQSATLDIPMGYRLAVSFEEQPAGLVAHFSISVDAPNSLPHQTAVRALLDIAGYDMDFVIKQWIEEFLLDGQPGGLAINLCFLVGQTQQVGTA
jgi:hypothetical protein